MQKEVILGSGGVIGNEIARTLAEKGRVIRLVARNPEKLPFTNDLYSADLTDLEQTKKAVKGCGIAYLTVGLEYNAKVWEEKWPRIMKNAINACKLEKCKLVFFDNVYMYGQVDGTMTEETPLNPISKKGKVRAEIARMLMHEMEKGTLKALIARSADFYGPNAAQGVANVLVFDNLAKSKRPQIMGDPDKIHSYTFTKDAAVATVMLAHEALAENQVWHLPTSPNPLTHRQFIEESAAHFDAKPKFTVLKKWLLKVLGVFIPVLREMPEMMYQYQEHYQFESAKFMRTFDFSPTSYKDGIRQTAESYQC